MNINVEYWGDTFGTREDMKDPVKNIRAGVEMLARIQSNIPGGSIEKIATLYNNINAISVSNYGMRVKRFYLEQPWLPNVGSTDDPLDQMKLANGLRGL